MATFSVRNGISTNLKAPETQVLIIGRSNVLKKTQFNQISGKLEGVTENIYNSALEELSSKGGSVPLYLNYVKLVGVSDTASRYNTSSNSYDIFKAKLSIVLVADYEHVLSSVSAIAKSFPLFTEKTTKDSKFQLQEISVEVVTSDEKKLGEQDLNFLQSLADSIRVCSRQVDTPCNILDTEIFANEAIELVKNLGVDIKTTQIKGNDLLEQGFGGLYNVGKAAVHKSILLSFSHEPNGATESCALVGKGIVFDTGGMQIKGSSTMKIDMGGAAAVLGAFCTLVKSGYKQNLHCILCIAENNISPEANKPDDIIKMLSGKTVEITNTDAEGRLVLADVATLTGAQRYATGYYHAAVLASREQSELTMLHAGKVSGDLCHPLIYAPDLHFSNLKSAVADMKNAVIPGKFDGPPSAIAGLFIAAQFDFNDEVDFIHVDIASPAWDGERATGYGPALLCTALAKNIPVPMIN